MSLPWRRCEHQLKEKINLIFICDASNISDKTQKRD